MQSSQNTCLVYKLIIDIYRCAHAGLPDVALLVGARFMHHCAYEMYVR